MCAQPVDRRVISRGPAIIKYNGGTFFSREDIELQFQPETGEVDSSAFGKLFDYTLDQKPELSVQLVGEVEHLDTLFPYATTPVGTSIFGAVDTPLEIIPVDTNQQKLLFHNAAVKQMPNLKLTGEGIVFDGSVDFALGRKNNTLPQADDAFFRFEENDWDGSGLDVDKIFIQSYDVRWLSDGTWFAMEGTPVTSGPLTVGDRYVIAKHFAGDKFASVGASQNADGTEFIATGTTPTAWASGSILLNITGKTGGSLESGRRYLIAKIESGDDFGNVGATANQSGETFVATGTTPTTWSNSSELIEISEDLDWNATDTEVATAINGTAWGEGAGDVSVAGDVETGYAISHVLTGAQNWITGRVANMPGGTHIRYDLQQQGDGSNEQLANLSLFPWSLFPSREGITVEFDLEISEDKADSVGTFDFIFNGLSVSAKMVPMNVSQETMLAAMPIQGSEAKRGRRVAENAHDLVIKATEADQAFFVILKGANIVDTGLIFSRENQRIPETEWRASRTVSGGSVDPLFVVTTTEPTL